MDSVCDMSNNNLAIDETSPLNFVNLTESPLNVAAVSASVASHAAGAISLFVGTTRDNFNEKSVVSLEYEAYAPMAVREMHKLCSKARAKWPAIKRIAIHHRLGTVPVGEASVVIGISSPHRNDAIGKFL